VNTAVFRATDEGCREGCAVGVVTQRSNTEGAEVDVIDVGALVLVFDDVGDDVGPVERMNVGMEVVGDELEEVIVDGIVDGIIESSTDGETNGAIDGHKEDDDGVSGCAMNG